MQLSIFPYTVVQKLFASLLWRLSGERDVRIDESHPANQEVIAYLRAHSEERSKWAPNYYDKPYEMQADVDLDEALHDLGKGLPQHCFSVCCGYPVLAYPKGGVIFAVARDGVTIALRLPPTVRTEVLTTSTATDVVKFPESMGYPNNSIHASEFGKDWIFIGIWGSDEDRIPEWVLAAYGYTGELAGNT